MRLASETPVSSSAVRATGNQALAGSDAATADSGASRRPRPLRCSSSPTQGGPGGRCRRRRRTGRPGRRCGPPRRGGRAPRRGRGGARPPGATSRACGPPSCCGAPWPRPRPPPPGPGRAGRPGCRPPPPWPRSVAPRHKRRKEVRTAAKSGGGSPAPACLRIKKDHPVFITYSNASSAAFAPSPAAIMICLLFTDVTSPAAKTPGRSCGRPRPR